MIGKRFAILICVAATGLMALGAPGPAAAKEKHPANPWAGTWTGMTEATPSGPPAPISFRITKRGMVIGLTTTVITFDRGGGCPAPTPATVNMRPVRMISPAPGKPRKSFEDLADPNGVSPPGTFGILGKAMTSRRIDGVLGFRVEPSPGLFCGTGNVHWTVRR